MNRNHFYTVVLSVSVFAASCSSGPEDKVAAERKAMTTSIDSAEKKLFKANTTEIDREVAEVQLQKYTDFVNKFPTDTLSPEYLFRASDLARGMGYNKRAIEFLALISNGYPDYKRMAECLFLQGYYYQEFFRDTVQARGFYDQLIAKYPNHAFANDAKALMTMFGKSEAEIIKGFEAKAEEKAEEKK